MTRREAAATATAQLRLGYFDQREQGGSVYVQCPAPCREKVRLDPFTRTAEIQARLRDALTEHLMEAH